MLPFVVPKWQFKVRQEAKVRPPRATQQWRMTRFVALTKRIATAQQTSHSNNGLIVACISTNSCGTPHATACPSTCFHFHAAACERCVQVLQGGVRRENVLATDYS